MKFALFAFSIAPSASALCCYDGCEKQPASCNAADDWCSQSSDNCGTCSGDWCDGGPTPAPTPTPTPTPPSSDIVEYCPDPATDFQEERESGATGVVTYTDNGWSTKGWMRISSKASFDFTGGGAWYDMDLSNAHNGVNNNMYVTYPYSDNCGISCYCDSGGNHDSQGRGCAEMDWTENNGQCYSATTWHDSSDGSDGPGYGDHTNLNSGMNSYSAVYSADGSKVDLTVNDHTMSGGSHQHDMQSKGAVLYSSQWVGWVPGDFCGGDGNLGESIFEVKNLKIRARVVQGPEPRRCDAVTADPAVV